MEPIISPNLTTLLKDKHLLLDTNVFIDASFHLTFFTKLFTDLTSCGTTLVTSDLVKSEFLKGAPDNSAYSTKELFLNRFAKFTLPTDQEVIKNIDYLIKEYKLDGQNVSIVDLSLGGLLKKYGDNLLLMTKNVNDFPIRIFKLVGVINFPKDKGIYSYGVYSIN